MWSFKGNNTKWHCLQCPSLGYVVNCAACIPIHARWSPVVGSQARNSVPYIFQLFPQSHTHLLFHGNQSTLDCTTGGHMHTWVKCAYHRLKLRVLHHWKRSHWNFRSTLSRYWIWNIFSIIHNYSYIVTIQSTCKLLIYLIMPLDPLVSGGTWSAQGMVTRHATIGDNVCFTSI
jgi:hypothetical protein